MQAPPFPVDEASRIRLLHSLKLLDSDQDATLDGLVRCAAALLATPTALLSLVDEGRQWFLSRVGMEAQETPREISFCGHAILSDTIFEIPDAAADPRFVDNPLVKGAPGIRFYAGAPLRVDGQAIGTLCVIDGVPRRLSGPERATLKDLAAAVQGTIVRGRAHRELALSEARFRDFAALSADWLWESDAQGVLRWVSQPGGRKPRSLGGAWRIGAPIPAAACLDASGVPVYPARQFADLLRRRVPISSTLVAVQGAANSAEVLSIAARPLADAQGRFNGWRGHAEDATERLQREARDRNVKLRWRSAVDAAGLAMIQFDLVQGTVSLDERAAEIHGFPAASAHADLELGRFIERVRHEDRAALHSALTQASKIGAPPVQIDYRIAYGIDERGPQRIDERRDPMAAGEPEDGSARSDADDPECGRATAVIGLVLVRADEDEPPGRLNGLCSDHGGHARIERMRVEKRAAEQSSRVKSRFLSRASHELRTPLNAMMGFAELMTMPGAAKLDAEQAQRVARIREAGHRLLSLIDDMLEVSHIDSGERPLATVPVDLGAAVDRARSALQPLVLQRLLRLKLDVPAGLRVRADPRGLDQILLHLMSNAVKYNRPGGVVTVHARSDGVGVLIGVDDDGPGIGLAQQRDLFEPFSRLGAEGGEVPGTGLGLVIARSLAQRMGGGLSLSSVLGEGTQILLSLRAADAAVPGLDKPEAGSALTGIGSERAQRTVIYVEDDPVNVVLVEQLFAQRPAWRLRVAKHGARGLAMALAQTPDLVLTDINLPHMSGTELMQALRRDPALSKVPCIALSADALAEQIESALAAGFNDYWVKPLDLRAALGRLDALLSHVPGKSPPVAAHAYAA